MHILTISNKFISIIAKKYEPLKVDREYLWDGNRAFLVYMFTLLIEFGQKLIKNAQLTLTENQM